MTQPNPNQSGNRSPSNPNQPGMPGGRPPQAGRMVMGWLLVVCAGLLIYSLIGSGDRRRKITITEFESYVQSGRLIGTVRTFQDRIEGENSADTPGLEKDAPRKFVVDYPVSAEYLIKLEADLSEYAPGVQLDYARPSWWAAMLPHLLISGMVVLLIWFLLFRRMGAGGGGGLMGGFARSRHKVASKEQSKIRFSDVAGIDEAKEEVSEIIEFLRYPKKFQRLGGRIPRGVLLVGEPGCGKTLLAKAIAGEAEVPVFVISGSDFMEMFVGVGASRVRDLFQQARQNAPCIIFLDEIDAIGRRRSDAFSSSGAQDERDQTLNAILVEMDGLGSSDQVIIVAATNRVDVLDPALTRPGRFDRQINVPLPDLAGREQILGIYADKVRLDDNVNLQRLARGTPMFSGADLEALVNEAAISATLAGKDCVAQEDLEEARDKVRWGRARKSRVIDEKEKETTAYHEAGHALIQVLEDDADPLHKVSIIPRGGAGGATFALPEKDRYLYTRRYCGALLCVCFGGRVAEELFCGDISSGASMDIAQATEIARQMVIDWGMSEKLGMINYAGNPKRRAMFGDMTLRDFSEETARLIDAEIKQLIDTALERTRATMAAHREEVAAIAEALLRFETLEAEEVQRIINGEALEKALPPTVDQLLSQEQAPADDDA
jgi:cell division protease FtsH